MLLQELQASERPGADDGFSTDLQLDAHLVETWATYDDGVVAGPGNGSLPLPADLTAGRELTQLYERLIRDAKAANPAFFDAAEDDVTWAIVWPRPLSASVETLLAHRWAFWAAAEALDEEAYRMIALDAVVCEIRGRLASAHASKGASYEPGPLAAAALDIAVCWRRARSVITDLQHRLLPKTDGNIPDGYHAFRPLPSRRRAAPRATSSRRLRAMTTTVQANTSGVSRVILAR